MSIRKRDLGRIAIAMGKTGIIERGFNKAGWETVRLREVEFSRTVSREIVEFARYWGAGVISFEH
ncbi:MAG: hypothetical protein ACREPR_25020, partial [Brasilonema sp.]